MDVEGGVFWRQVREIPAISRRPINVWLPCRLATYLIADTGYDNAVLRDWLTVRSTISVIPPRSDRRRQYHYDKKLFRERNIIERTFNRFKDFRRIAARFDR
ncbi:MAG: hypothetical protein K9G33_06900 [Sneathiella sp.]|nr:hypothetical protein [Sneathiella sp.]